MKLSHTELMEAVSQQLHRRRVASETALAEHEAECRALDPRFESIRAGLAQIGIEIARVAMSPDGPQRVGELAQKSRSLQAERVRLLEHYGKPADYLVQKHTCPICRDTGLDGPGRCRCVDRLYAELSAQRLNEASPLSVCSFDDFSLEHYPTHPDPVLGRSPREIMEEVLDYAKRYALTFSERSRSLLLWGKPGLGKTHIALAIAGEVMKKGRSVVYLPSGQLFSAIEREKFSRDSDDDTLSTVLEADLLIIDDLGTEFVTALTQTNLYQVIDSRLRSNAPTIVSTNLEDGELRQKYPERLVSRLLYSYEDLLFAGNDIRKIKKFQ